jgi:hypothetical protein
LTDLLLSSCASACLALFMADMFFFTAGCADNVIPPYDLRTVQICSIR